MDVPDIAAVIQWAIRGAGRAVLCGLDSAGLVALFPRSVWQGFQFLHAVSEWIAIFARFFTGKTGSHLLSSFSMILSSLLSMRNSEKQINTSPQVIM